MDEDLIGGRFKRLEEIGAGGMARVYRARDTRLERDVAVKVVLDESGDESKLFYFHREARAIASLQHPNIVPIFDYSGPEEIPAYIVMQLVPTGDLEQILDGRDLPPELFIMSVAQSVGAALEHAHHKGVIHRDLKLSNILIDESGRLLLTDFGLAKGYRDQAILGDTAVHEESVLFGTPNYMAPEQLRGKKPGPASDIFSLGVILYFLSVGELPFDNPAPAVVMQNIVDGNYPPLHPSAAADRSGRLVGLIERCLAVEPELRPLASEVVAVAEEVLADNDAHKVELNVRDFLGMPGSQPLDPELAERAERHASGRLRGDGGPQRRSSAARSRASSSPRREAEDERSRDEGNEAEAKQAAKHDDTVISPQFFDDLSDTVAEGFGGEHADTIDERFPAFFDPSDTLAEDEFPSAEDVDEETVAAPGEAGRSEASDDGWADPRDAAPAERGDDGRDKRNDETRADRRDRARAKRREAARAERRDEERRERRSEARAERRDEARAEQRNDEARAAPADSPKNRGRNPGPGDSTLLFPDEDASRASGQPQRRGPLLLFIGGLLVFTAGVVLAVLVSRGTVAVGGDAPAPAVGERADLEVIDVTDEIDSGTRVVEVSNDQASPEAPESEAEAAPEAEEEANPPPDGWVGAIEQAAAQAEAERTEARGNGGKAKGERAGAKATVRPTDSKRRKRGSKSGTLQVVAKPWGTIVVDGEKRGNTPLFNKLKLAPGEHTVVASHPDHKFQMRKVTIVAGQTTKVVFTFGK